MAFNGKEGGQISLDTASHMTAAYRAANPGEILARFFGKNIIHDILAQDGCMGIRIYYGLNTEGTPELILVGADANENDMTGGIIADVSLPCPSRCGSSNKLNG